jgi:hypothetical protein
VAKNIIELNGKQYDAVSGAFMSSTAPKQAKTPPVVDNFMHAKPAPVRPTIADPLQAQPAHHHSKTPAQHITAHRPEHPKTLMRRAVQRPDIAAPAKLKVAAPAPASTSLIKPSNSLHKQSVSSINQSRMARAKQVNQLGVINRFSDIGSRPPQPALVGRPYAPTAYNSPATAQNAVQPRSESQALFDKALANATSHQQTYSGKAASHGMRRGHVAIIASAFALIFAGGFLMYHSVPSMNLNIASAKAGFHASMPSYQPPGFSLGQFTYGPGSVTISYRSNSDTRKFSVVQRTSTWDSAALLSNFVKVTKQQYQTYQVSGRTVYLYGDNNATWVDGGIWYVVNGETALSNNQLLKMAGSL